MRDLSLLMHYGSQTKTTCSLVNSSTAYVMYVDNFFLSCAPTVHLEDGTCDKCMKTFPNDIIVMHAIAHLSKQLPLQPNN